MTTIELLKKLLEDAATKRPWNTVQVCPFEAGIFGGGMETSNPLWVARHVDDLDARLIANAINALPGLIKKIEAYEEALRFYGEEKNWETTDWGSPGEIHECVVEASFVLTDDECGNKAREVLEKWKDKP